MVLPQQASARGFDIGFRTATSITVMYFKLAIGIRMTVTLNNLRSRPTHLIRIEVLCIEEETI